MCGRAYHTYTDEELELRYLSERRKRQALSQLKPTYNLAPTQLSPIVYVKDGQNRLDLFRWGLIPGWAKDIKSAAKYSLINARGEEITEKRSYAEAFKKRRCIVPLSGFFEWCRPEKGPKHPFAISLNDAPIMSVAGIWENWQSPKDDPVQQEIYSFSIITTEANSAMEPIHDRMPVILDRKDEQKWLDPENNNIEQLRKLLLPCPSTWLKMVEISALVNSPKNNTPQILEPVGATSFQDQTQESQLLLDESWRKRK